MTPLEQAVDALRQMAATSLKRRDPALAAVWQSIVTQLQNTPANSLMLVDALAQIPEQDIDALDSVHDLMQQILESTPQKDPQQRALMNYVLRMQDRGVEKKCVNIGGGPMFCGPGWINVERVPSPKNPRPLNIDESLIIPAEDKTISLAYTRHHIEHLPLETVHRVFEEVRRVLADDGSFVVALPDYDEIIAKAEAGDQTFFDENFAGQEKMFPMWRKRGIEPTFVVRALTSMCKYWNLPFGGESALYDGTGNYDHADAYLGPPIEGNADADELFAMGSPKAITEIMAKRVFDMGEEAFIDHQTAWDTDEMIDDLERLGFDVISTNKAQIAKRFASLHRINLKLEKTAIYLAVPKLESTDAV